jgi:hypothetical protein
MQRLHKEEELHQSNKHLCFLMQKEIQILLIVYHLLELHHKEKIFIEDISDMLEVMKNKRLKNL